MTKTCTTCHIEKPLNEYWDEPLGKYGKKARCKGCKKDYERGFRRVKRQRGKCRSCAKDAIQGRATCVYHAEKGRKYRQTQYKGRVEKGKCVTCGTPLHEDMDRGKRGCLNCREKL